MAKQPIAQGWECPRCGRVNAPTAEQCWCMPGPVEPEPATEADDIPVLVHVMFQARPWYETRAHA
jgi:hypothetical protein